MYKEIFNYKYFDNLNKSPFKDKNIEETLAIQ